MAVNDDVENVRRSPRLASQREVDWEEKFALSRSSQEQAKKIRRKRISMAICSENPAAPKKNVVYVRRAERTEQAPICKTPKLKEVLPLKQSFFECDAVDLAPRLLGKLLRREDVVLQITEVEAYRQDDTACHARFGKTPRTAPLFGQGGHAYVYLCYGLHVMLNVVADKDGVGAAVLIRSCAPVSGLETIQTRRKQQTIKPILLTGPGKIGQALGLTTQWSSHPLFSPGGLEILDGSSPDAILVGPRVGIEYALPKDVIALWRFAIAGTPWVSAPRNTLQLQKHL
ncbi:DNA-3-methyladenine glycosylase [Selaginella moellendorffii]|nr:DNA-3-methyladenine glycosylase [Selaginella moellendorffii]|eukprot:XP_002973434.2 DNA-3-methyladenine glycosylase [Selaginella moellendorffii]